MSISMTADDGDANLMMEMNTTPLIDVMLVLLIMFIITIPIQTHAVKIDLPQKPPKTIVVKPVRNKIVVDAAGAVLWNGQAVDLPTLTRTLEDSQRMPEVPELHLEPVAEARYERVDEVLAITKRVGVEKMGFVGNERYREF